MDHSVEKGVRRTQRTGHSKVRTGCKTCKQRRVKCDELKPKCKRCYNFGVDCDGYAQTIPHPQPAAPKRIIPRLYLLPQHSTISRTPSRSLFKTQQEYRYFQLFRTQTTTTLAGYFCPKFWQTLVLQVCETDAPIRHAAVALGALNFNTSPSEKRNFSKQHQFALREYSKAILQIRQRVEGGKVGAGSCWGNKNLRVTLIACLLFACFEAFHGFLDAAMAQVHSGVRMIGEWMTALHDCHDKSDLTSLYSPKPNVIEDELVQIFARLDLEALAPGHMSAEWQHYQRFFGQHSMDTMPAKFLDLKEARAYQELVERRAMHWMPWIEVQSGPTLTLCFTHAKETQNCDESLEEEKKLVIAEGAKWTNAFEPLWIHSRREEGKSIFMGATVLKLQSLVAHLCKTSVACSRDFLCEDSTSQLREILNLSRTLIEFTESWSSCRFSLDAHVIYPLAVVGLRFKHRALRREAIALLLERNWREGVWDSWVVGRMVEWIANIEDGGLIDGGHHDYVPEENVAREVRMQHDIAGRKTTVSCLQPLKGTGGELIPRQVVIRWL